MKVGLRVGVKWLPPENEHRFKAYVVKPNFANEWTSVVKEKPGENRLKWADGMNGISINYSVKEVFC